jgi:adenine-specific DNA-methyltransferase
LDNVASNSDGTKDLKTLFPEVKKVFSYPKPVKLIKHLLKIVDNKNAIVLDFFAGSGTTAQATLDINKEDGGNRLFVLIEQMNYVETLTVERVKRAIKHFGYNSGFVYLELLELNHIFVSRIKKESDKSKLIDIWKEMLDKAFLGFRVSDSKLIGAKTLEQQSVEDLKKFLLDTIDNNMLYVPVTEIEDADYGVDAATNEYNKQFFGDFLDV